VEGNKERESESEEKRGDKTKGMWRRKDKEGRPRRDGERCGKRREKK
jgi:hypothetical protein